MSCLSWSLTLICVRFSTPFEPSEISRAMAQFQTHRLRAYLCCGRGDPPQPPIRCGVWGRSLRDPPMVSTIRQVPPHLVSAPGSLGCGRHFMPRLGSPPPESGGLRYFSSSGGPQHGAIVVSRLTTCSLYGNRPSVAPDRALWAIYETGLPEPP